MFKGKKLVSLLAATAMTVSSFAMSVPAVSFAAEESIGVIGFSSAYNDKEKVVVTEDESNPVFSLKVPYAGKDRKDPIATDVIKFELPDLVLPMGATFNNNKKTNSLGDLKLKLTDAKIKDIKLSVTFSPSDAIALEPVSVLSEKYQGVAVVADPEPETTVLSVDEFGYSCALSLGEADAWQYLSPSDLNSSLLDEVYQGVVGQVDNKSVEATTFVTWELAFDAPEWMTVDPSAYEYTYEGNGYSYQSFDDGKLHAFVTTTGKGNITENYTGKQEEETKEDTNDVTGKDYDHEYDGNGNKIKQGDTSKQEGTTPSATDTTTPAPSGEPTDTTTPAPSGEPTDTTTPAPTDEPTSTVEAGKVFELEDGATIKVTKNGKNCIIESIPSDVEEYTIPEFMTVGDVQLPVVKIATGAIVGKSNLKKLTILAKLNKIQKKALYDDANLETIAWSHPSTLKTLGKLNLRYLANGAKIQAGEPFSVPIEVKVKNRMGADAIAY